MCQPFNNCCSGTEIGQLFEWKDFIFVRPKA